MKKHWFYILACLLLASCGKLEFYEQMDGTWQVTEFNYVFDNGTVSQPLNNRVFVFDDIHYQSYQNDTLIESGTFSVNNKVTQITFHTMNGNSRMIIQERNDTYQHWRSKIKIVDFYLEFKLSKVQ